MYSGSQENDVQGSVLGKLSHSQLGIHDHPSTYQSPSGIKL